MVWGLSTGVKEKIDKVVWKDRHEICFEAWYEQRIFIFLEFSGYLKGIPEW